MIQDRMLKANLLEYYTKRFWYPQLEVNILSKQRLSNTKKLVTDVDALGLFNDATGYFRMVVGDCKTLKNTSPITRVLWMKGLMAYLNAPKGIILLSKSVEKEHQLTASTLDIQLLSDTDFPVFSKNTADYIVDLRSALSNIDNWDIFFGVSSRYPNLRPFLEYSQTQFWNEQNYSYQLRSGIYVLKSLKGEINPSNNLHQSVILNHFSLIALALHNIAIQIFSQYLVPSDKQDLDQDLRIIIYGGIENYSFLNDLRKKFTQDATTEDLKLPEWDKLVEFVRLILNNPLSFADVSLLLKEISFKQLSQTSSDCNYASAIAKRNKFVTTYCLRHVDYLCHATGVPKDLKDALMETILEVERNT